MVGRAARAAHGEVAWVSGAVVAGVLACTLWLAPSAGAQEDPSTTVPTTAASTTVPVTTTSPPTTPPPTTPPPTTPAPETTAEPATTAPPSGGGGGPRAPVTTARPKAGAAGRATTTRAPETTETTAPPETPPPATEAPTTVPSTEEPPTPSTTTPGTVPPTTAAPTSVDSVPADSVSSAGKVLSFLIIAALGLLATVIALGSRRRQAPADPALVPIPPLGAPVPGGPRLTTRSSGVAAKGAGASTGFVPFTRITSASGVVSGEVPVSGVNGARAAHAAGAMHERYPTVDDPAASGPITAEVDIVDTRAPETASRFGTDGPADATGTSSARRAGGPPRWAVPKEAVAPGTGGPSPSDPDGS